MKITLFTSSLNRHNYLVNLLSQICDELFVVQEVKEVNNGIERKYDPNSKIMMTYFKNVEEAQIKFFGNSLANNNNIKILSIKSGDLNKYKLETLKEFLRSDYYVVFGSSFIKGELIDFLIKKRAINIHMGVSPFYRGTDCNFWALFDNNPHLVGATIHLISKNLDNGPILFHAMSKLKDNPFEYTMSTVKSAFHSLVNRIKEKSIMKSKTKTQKSFKKIRISKRIDFNEDAVKKFLEKNIDLDCKEFDKNLLIEPYFLNN